MQASFRPILQCALLLALSLVALPGAAVEIYKYVDQHGRVHLTDRPPHDGYQLIPRFGRSLAKTQRINYRDKELNKQRFSRRIARVARQYEVPEALIHAVISIESAYDPNAVSRAGAVGLMQLMPATAKRYGVANRRDPAANLRGGTRYLRDLLNLFNSDLELVLAGYNAGENAVKKYGNRIPPFPETQNYVRKVLKVYAQQSTG